MAVTQKFGLDAITCDVVEAVTAGQLVEARAASGSATQRPVGVAAAGSSTVRGIALLSATNAAQSATLVYPLPVSTSVAQSGHVAGVTFAGTATDGAALKAAASGQVTPWVSGTDAANLIIGYAVGAVTSGQTGTVRLNIA